MHDGQSLAKIGGQTCGAMVGVRSQVSILYVHIISTICCNCCKWLFLTQPWIGN
jgi:hypothetical protein